MHADRVQVPEPRPPLRPRGRGALRRRRSRHGAGRGPHPRPGARLLRARLGGAMLHPQHQQDHRRPLVRGGHQLQARPGASQAHRDQHPGLLRPAPEKNRRVDLQRHLLGRPSRYPNLQPLYLNWTLSETHQKLGLNFWSQVCVRF